MYQGRIASSPVCCNPGRFLDKRRFIRINLRKQHAFRYPTSDGSRGAAGGPALPSIFRLKPESETEARNWGPKGGKKIFGGNRLPSSSNLSKGLDDRPPSPPLPFLISRSGSSTAHYWFPSDVWGTSWEIPHTDDESLTWSRGETRSGFAKSSGLFS